MMNYESLEPAGEAAETKLSGFQNDSFLNDPMQQDLMPKICFTTDAAEAAEAAAADRSDPMDLPDTVFYVEPKEAAEGEAEKKAAFLPGFQNDTLDIKVEPMEGRPSGDTPSGDYVGPSSAALDSKIEQATRDLTYAQVQLAEAIANGTGVMTAMHVVETAQKLLDTYVQQHSVAVMAEAKQAANMVGAKSGGEVSFGSSVSHAQWELEKAYESGNSIRIHNAERNLAHEKAKEAAKD